MYRYIIDKRISYKDRVFLGKFAINEKGTVWYEIYDEYKNKIVIGNATDTDGFEGLQKILKVELDKCMEVSTIYNALQVWDGQLDC